MAVTVVDDPGDDDVDNDDNNDNDDNRANGGSDRYHDDNVFTSEIIEKLKALRVQGQQ